MEKAETAFDVRALLNAHRDTPLTQATIDEITALVDSDRLLAANEGSIRRHRHLERERELRETAHSRLLTDEENQEMIELTDGEYKPYTKEMQEGGSEGRRGDMGGVLGSSQESRRGCCRCRQGRMR